LTTVVAIEDNGGGVKEVSAVLLKDLMESTNHFTVLTEKGHTPGGFAKALESAPGEAVCDPTPGNPAG